MPTVNGVKKLVLYLEEWQKQMIKDFLHVECHTYEIEIPVPSPPHTKYGIWTNDRHKRMYFTEWQKREMRDETGVECEFIELRDDYIKPLYMPPHSAKQS
jgi:hypothetical protein